MAPGNVGTKFATTIPTSNTPMEHRANSSSGATRYSSSDMIDADLDSSGSAKNHIVIIIWLYRNQSIYQF